MRATTVLTTGVEANTTVSHTSPVKGGKKNFGQEGGGVCLGVTEYNLFTPVCFIRVKYKIITSVLPSDARL